jgi:hypothetical protein
LPAAVILSLLLLFRTAVFSQDDGSESVISRGSIPEDLLRPAHGEDPRYPIDTIIGELGQGKASAASYAFAKSIAGSLVAGNADRFDITGINPLILDSYLSLLEPVNSQYYRIGSGREEADGAVSFLVRFIGREQAVSGELFIRFTQRQKVTEEQEGEAAQTQAELAGRDGVWVFEELILEQARSRELELQMTRQNHDFAPYYERFF